TWRPYRRLGSRISPVRRRESFLSFYGPLSLILLLALWALTMVLGFGTMLWAFGSRVQSVYGVPNFWDDLYMSGTTFFTLGLGDVLPHSAPSRVITFFEGALGFAFLGIVIGYLPVIYSSFSQRERAISLLDARAGNPPSAAELLIRYSREKDLEGLQGLLQDWERWASEVLESHLSYPVLAYFRSQHDNESWLAALTVILDTSALIISGIDGLPKHQAQLTYAMARHAMVDLSQVFNSTPIVGDGDRLPAEEMRKMRSALEKVGVVLACDENSECQLNWLRERYEPYVKALARYLRLTLPPFYTETKRKDNWQSSAWKQQDSSSSRTPEFVRQEGHF
ncbi:MAG TPA: potassium channel family protein, partial [Terriglobales bacterium]